MRFVTIAILVALFATYASCASFINDKFMIERVNNHPRATWKAKAYPKFDGKTIEQVKHLLGTTLSVQDTLNIPRYNPKRVGAVPATFDAREQWPSCKFAIRDQQRCGSCWAFSAAQALEDRFCIATNESVLLSPEYMVECDHSNYGCQGGYLSNTWKFLAKVGTVTEECDPYYSGSGNVGQCPKTCKDGSEMKFYKADKNSLKLFSKYNLESIQEDIAKFGSVQAGFDVYQDFFSYSSGVYRHVTGGLAGGHAVKIIGWGVDQNTKLPYWIIANSWGADWGMNGFFWMLRGKDECGIESEIWSGRADI